MSSKKKKVNKMKATREEFYKEQNKRLANRTEQEKKLDADTIHQILIKLQGKK